MGSKLMEDAITLFVVVNPIGLVPLFIALTTGQTAAQRRAIARRAVLIAAAILIVFVVIGQVLLTGLGVTLPAFRVAGGLVLLVIALRRVLSEGDSRGSAEPGQGGGPSDIAVFPLAMPFIAGPGAVMAAVLLTDNDTFTVAEQAATAGVMMGVLAITYVMLLGAEIMQRLIGPTGANVLGRVLGLVLAAVAAETMLEGLRASLIAR